MPERGAAAVLRVGATLLVLALLIVWSDPQSLVQVLGDVAPMLWLAAALVISGATLAGGLGLHLLLRKSTGRDFRDFLPVYWVAWAAGLITPGQIGDMATISLILKRRGIDWRGTLGRSLLDKGVSLAVMVGVAACGILSTWHVMSANTSTVRWALMAALGIVAVLAAGLIIQRHPRLQPIRSHLLEIAASFLDTLRYQPGAVALNFLLTLLKLMLIGTGYWLMLRAFGAEPPSILTTTALATASGLLAYLPVSFNGIGPVEVAGVALFGIHGIDGTVVLASYLALRATVLALAWIPAAAVLLTWRARPPTQEQV